MSLLTVGGVLILLALIFLIVSAVRPFPLWPAVLCVILERIVALGGPAVR